MDEQTPVDQGTEQPAEAAVTGETNCLSHAPWWLVSAGIHVVLVLTAMLIYVEKAIAIEDNEIIISRSSEQPTLVKELDRPRDPWERKGIPKEETSAAPTEEKAIFFPEAKPSNRNESNDNEAYQQMKGDSKDYLSYIKGEGGGFRGRTSGLNPGQYDVMGVGRGAGGGGRYGGRFGGKEDLVADGGGTKGTESAVLEALKWLARHQSADGSWSADHFSDACVTGKCSGGGVNSYDTGLTGLSLLAFLGAGYSHLSKDEFRDPAMPSRWLKFGDVCKKAVRWLMEHQDPEGCIGERGEKYMYNHAIAALAISEAYEMTAAPMLKHHAQKAIDFLVAAQNPGKGWRYRAKCGDNDTSVTGWCVMALKSAESAGLDFPRSCYDGAIAWLNEATEDGGYYPVGYTHKAQGKTIIPGKNENFDGHHAMAAVSVMSRIFMNKNKKEPALNAVLLLTGDLPKWGPGSTTDFYYWYYASLAVFQYDGPKGPMWGKWNEPMKNALVPNQKTKKDNCENGSWDPKDERWGCEGGRVYMTAIGAMTLEVYYRYKNVFGTK